MDLFLKTVHGGHASERVRRHCELFLASHFSTSWEQILRKAVLPRHATTPSFGLLDFSFGLLALACGCRCFCFVSVS
jgi:hypothetical protein